MYQNILMSLQHKVFLRHLEKLQLLHIFLYRSNKNSSLFLYLLFNFHLYASKHFIIQIIKITIHDRINEINQFFLINTNIINIYTAILANITDKQIPMVVFSEFITTFFIFRGCANASFSLFECIILIFR